MSGRTKRGLLVLVVDGLLLALLWVLGFPFTSVAIAYILGIWAVLSFAVGTVANRLWPDGRIKSSEAARRLVSVMPGAILYAAAALLLSQWTAGEHIMERWWQSRSC